MLRKITLSLFTAVFLLSACNSTTKGIFGKKTPIEKYEEKLNEAKLDETPEGRQWKAASERALTLPVAVGLPYRQAGVFSTSKPQALGLRFSAQRGHRLHFNLKKQDSTAFMLYAELYRLDGSNKPQLLQSPDTNIADFTFDVAEAGDYLLKIQPQLYRVGKYDLSIATGPSLLFPVGDKKAYIGSVWGDQRDGGKRSHEGVDIFAAKRTPAVAAADGYISSVREGGIGGKTVWLRPEGQAITLYYAHLDEQLVQEGQQVKKGDVVGLVGNTGNAKYTPSHLHFGIYGYGGAVNPFPFVNRQVTAAAALTNKKTPELIRLTKDLKEAGSTIAKNTVLTPLAVTAKGYIAELPDGRTIQAPFAGTQTTVQALKKSTTIANTPLLKGLENQSPLAGQVAAGSAVSVLGYYNDFVLVETGTLRGWLPQAVLKV